MAKKVSSKKMAAKIEGAVASSRRDALVPGDPPIIVGGGGSTLVWIRDSVLNTELTAAQIAAQIAAHPNLPRPATPALYHVFPCDVNIGSATVKADNGTPSVKHNGLDSDRHSTKFEA